MTNLGCQFDTSVKKEHQLRNRLHKISLWACLGIISMIYMNETILSGTIHWRVSLWTYKNGIRKLAKNEHWRKPVSSIPLWSLLQFLPPGIPLMFDYNHNEINFFLQVGFGQCLSHKREVS